MLHAKDLMIGDWVAFQGHPYQMTANDIASIADCEARGVPTDLSEIPLTPEILEKNGFKDAQFYAELLWNDAFQIISDCTSLSIRCKNSDLSLSIPCDTVHELQHLIRLCGIEKEIVL